jgi:bifunctional non-homologous end joining protein LigD
MLPLGFVPPCLPTKAPQPPTGALWLHEIKHDGFRVIARKDGDHVRLHSRPGNSLTERFPLIVEALLGLPSCSCIIDGEAVCCDDKGIRASTCCGTAAVTAPSSCDLMEFNGDDLRREPLEVRQGDARLCSDQGRPRRPLERAYRSGWPHCVRPRLQDGP